MNYEMSHLEMLSHAFDFYGMRETPGEDDNPQIVQFFHALGFDWVQDDETGWCSAFINYLAKVNGYEYSGKLNARSWLDTGVEMKLPTVGDIVVLWRESPESWKGHVGMFARHDGVNIWVLGGNQGNAVNISPYPMGRLLGYRRLRKR